MIEEFEVKMMVWGGSNGKKIEKIKKNKVINGIGNIMDIYVMEVEKIKMD